MASSTSEYNMAEVFLNTHGNGYARTDALPPMVQGEQFTIVFVPDPGEFLMDVRAYDSYDYSVALPPVVNNEITMTWRTSWRNLYVDIYFSGSEPPGPEPLKKYPLWLLLTRKRQRRKIVNY